MDDGFSLSQLVENVFVQESYAEGEGAGWNYIANGVWHCTDNGAVAHCDVVSSHIW
jgi:hypothetical protein